MLRYGFAELAAPRAGQLLGTSPPFYFLSHVLQLVCTKLISAPLVPTTSPCSEPPEPWGRVETFSVLVQDSGLQAWFEHPGHLSLLRHPLFNQVNCCSILTR